MNSISIMKTKRQDQIVEVNTTRGKLVGKIRSIDLVRESCEVAGVWVPNPGMSQIVTTHFKAIHLAKTSKVEQFYWDNFELLEDSK